MDRKMELLIAVAGGTAAALFILMVVLNLNPPFSCIYVGTHLVCGALGWTLGGKGNAGIVGVIGLSVAFGWYGIAALIGTAIPTALFAWHEKRRTERETA